MKSPHLDPTWLRQKYGVEGLSTYEIGAIVGRDPKRIYEKLRDFGIPTRPRGHNLAGEDNYFTRKGVVAPFAGRRHSEATKRRLSEWASRPRPWLRGPKNGMSGRTGPRNPNYRDGSSPERQRLYASGEGRQFTIDILARDNYRCRRCHAMKSGRRSLHVHHVQPWAGNPSLRFDPENVVTLCRTCHEWVHSTANAGREFLAWRAERVAPHDAPSAHQPAPSRSNQTSTSIS